MAEFEENPKPVVNVEELQAKLATLQSKLAASKEPVVRDALESKIREITTELGPEMAAQAAEAAQAPAKKKKELEDLPLPEKPTPEAQLMADDFVRRARVAKMRGQLQEATDLIQQASRVAPGSVTVLEILGDEMVERKLYGDARRAYLTAHRLDPRNVAVERKYATMVLRASGGGMTIESALAIGLDSPFMNADDTMANAKVAIILSLIVPGVGQLVLGQTQKGLTLLGSYVVGLILLILLHTDFENTMKALRGVAHTGSAGFSLIPLVGMLVITIISVQGCAAKAKKDPLTGIKHVDRPVPPVNLPFE